MDSTIPRDFLRDPLLGQAVRAARDAGARALLVGGTVRDLLLGREPEDLDFACTDAPRAAECAARLLGTRAVPMGRGRFRSWRVPAGERHLDWAPMAGGDPEEDLRRRDFTLNAIALDPSDGTLRDPTGGVADIGGRRIRMTSEGALREDPLRVLRAFRLLATLPGFRIEEATEEALGRRAPALARVAAERVRTELELLLGSPAPGSAVRSMDRLGVLTRVLPELEPLRGLTQNAHHHADALEHTLQALEAADGPPAWLDTMGFPPSGKDLALLRLSLLLHDGGKAATRSVGPDGSVHFYGHPKVSADLARDALRRLRFPRSTEEAAVQLCLNHLRPLGLIKVGATRTALRRLAHDLGPLLPHLLALSYADKSASRGPGHEENLSGLRDLAARALEVARTDGEELRRLPKLVDGLEALAVLGLTRPGPELGRALDALMERQVEGTVTDREGALAFLADYARSAAS